MANGTICRTVYNSLDEAVSDWVGTNDTPTSGQWSPSNNNGKEKGSGLVVTEDR